MRAVFGYGLVCAVLVFVVGCERNAPANAGNAEVAAPAPSASISALTPDQLNDRLIERRAVEAVIWGLPAVNFELLYDSLVRAKGDWNQVVYWSRLADWKNQTLTPNPNVIYVFPFYDTRNGPTVLEIPPAQGDSSITGSVDDAWQTAIEDVGPAGVDKGKGGKYLITPPGYQGKVPAGYVPMPSSTFTGMVILRSNIGSGSDADIAKAVEYGKQVKLYPLAQAAAPPPTKFVDAVDIVYDNVIPYDLRFFEKLHAFVQREPWLERDRVMIDTLASIGIEKGKPFAPDAKTKSLLESAAREAHAWVDAAYDKAFAPYYQGHHWALPASPDVVDAMSGNFARTDLYPVTRRGMMYSFGYFSAKHLGQGQFYLMTTRDKDGKPLEGSNAYRLKVPADPPVSLYWSATVYDRSTHALIRNKHVASRASTTQGLKKNADGSVDVYFGPKPPADGESNWVPTSPDGRFEVLFRLYGPQKPLFDKRWVLPDLEKSE